MTEPADADARRAVAPVICYPVHTLPRPDMDRYDAAREAMAQCGEVIVPPREARTFRVPAGRFFRIRCIEGPQVGDLNLFNAQDLDERLYAGKTRALHGTHLSTGDLPGVLSTCPGGDCSAEHSSDKAVCHPLLVEIFTPPPGALAGWHSPPVSSYSGSHNFFTHNGGNPR